MRVLNPVERTGLLVKWELTRTTFTRVRQSEIGLKESHHARSNPVYSMVVCEAPRTRRADISSQVF